MGTTNFNDLAVDSLTVGGTPITATAAELNALASAGATNADLVKLHAVTATSGEINALAGQGAVAADFAKLAAADGAALASGTAVSGMPADLTEVSDTPTSGQWNTMVAFVNKLKAGNVAFGVNS